MDPLGVVVAIDQAIHAWLRAHEQPALTAALRIVSDLHRPRPMLVLAAALAMVFALRRDREALRLLLLALGGVVVNALVKHAVHRPRPGDLPGVVSDYAFPSGHVAWATMVYGCLALLVLLRARRLGPKLAAVGAALAAVTLVAASRLVLGAHYLSDVVVAAAGGVLWLALCAWIGRDRTH